MAPGFSYFVVAFLFLFSIHPFATASRSLKSETLSKNSFQMLLGVQKGRTMEEVIELKQYLKKFGYYPSDANITKKFDDSVESALKEYQKFYHLNVTGIVGPDTMKNMMMPRCGVADIIYHPSVKPTDRKDEHKHKFGKFHMVAHYAFFGGEPKWSRFDLTYTFQSEVEVISVETLRSVCQRAFQTWAAVSRFTFREATAGEKTDITVGFYRHDRGDGQPFDGPFPSGPTLAYGLAPERGIFHYDADENWSTSPLPSQFDLESVAVHELGHVLGLAHSQDTNAVMYSIIYQGATKRNLGQDDINGITALYSS